MVLADHDDDSPSGHPFKYARVLGIYHANVVHVGSRMVDYQPRRMEFLWVRWYQLSRINDAWGAQRLDTIRFPSVLDSDAFGFLDPSVVLRACHIIPCFKMDKLYPNGKGMSRCARDSSDWKEYFVGR
jgi:hypothetical protein